MIHAKNEKQKVWEKSVLGSSLIWGLWSEMAQVTSRESLLGWVTACTGCVRPMTLKNREMLHSRAARRIKTVQRFLWR